MPTDRNPLDSIPAYNRLSLRAVVTREGEDPTAVLAAAGIVNPVSFRCVVTDSAEEAARVLGPSIMPHFAVVLEPIYAVDGPLKGTDAAGPDPSPETANFSTTT